MPQIGALIVDFLKNLKIYSLFNVQLLTVNLSTEKCFCQTKLDKTA
jgi:hypothetical protein